MSVHNEALHFTPALRNLALEEGASLDHHTNVAEVARDLFIMKTERNAETKQNIRTEANLIVKDSERKIRKADRLFFSTLGSNAVGSGAVLTASVAMPILIPFFAVSAAVVGIGTLAARVRIDVKEETKKVWVYKNFPEAVRSDFIKKSACEIFDKEHAELKLLKNLEKDDIYYWENEEGESIFNKELHKEHYNQRLNQINLTKRAEMDALNTFIETRIYG